MPPLAPLHVPAPPHPPPQLMTSPVHELVKLTLHWLPQVTVFTQQVPRVALLTTTPPLEHVELPAQVQAKSTSGVPLFEND